MIMRRFLQILGLGGTNRRYDSLVDALLHLMKRDGLEKVIMDCPDRRTLLTVAAAELAVSPIDLGYNLAKIIDVPFLERINSVDIRALPSNCNISRFRKLGAIPVMKDGNITGIVCVDPALVAPLISELGDHLIYLSMWPFIAKALDESEEAFEKSEYQDKKESKIEAGRKVLGLLIEEVEGYGNSDVVIKVLETGIKYEFKTADGRKGHGQISTSIKTPLLDLLDQASAKGSLLFKLASKDVSRKVRVKLVQDEGFEFHLSWDLPLKADNTTNSAKVVAIKSVEKKAPQNTKNNDSEVATVTEQAGSKRKVVLVEDNETFASVISRFFARHNIDILHYKSGAEALQHLDSCIESPNLIICDVHMPNMNGIRFLDVLRQHGRFRNLPVVMLTSANDVDTEVQLLSGGADAYVGKNEDPRILCAHVERLLKRRQEAA